MSAGPVETHGHGEHGGGKKGTSMFDLIGGMITGAAIHGILETPQNMAGGGGGGGSHGHGHH